MILFNGYYVYEPELFQERKEQQPYYFIKAITFNSKNKFSFASKYSKNLKDIFFKKSEFKFENQNNSEYLFTDKEICLHQDIGEAWEGKFYYDKISDEKFVSRQTGKMIKFISWE
ncbi:MAG: hypothetical protein JXR05_05730 [Flavobacteriaceae bacterium]